MDLQALKAGAAQFAGLASMELPTLPERKDPDPFRKYSCEPIGLEEFAAQLKDSITDPISGKEVTLSQSRIKSFLQMIEDELCGKQVYHTSITREFDLSGKAAHMGRLFEHALGIGNAGGQEPPEQLLTKAGKKTTEQLRIERNAATHRENLKRLLSELGFDFENSDYQRSFAFKCLSGEADISSSEEGKHLITDVKYSGLLSGYAARNSPFGYDPETFADKMYHKIQARQYVLLSVLIDGVDLDSVQFMYYVADNRADKEGEYIPFRGSVSETGLFQHMHMILEVQDQLEEYLTNKRFTALPSYKQCKDCPLAKLSKDDPRKCKSAQVYPEVQEVEF